MEDNDTFIDVTEIVRMPRSHMEKRAKAQQPQSSESESKSQIEINLEKFLGAVLHLDILIAFRIQFLSGIPRMLYLTESTDAHASAVGSAFAAQFPDFSIQTKRERAEIPVDGQAYVALLTGIPKTSPDALNGLVHIMKQAEGFVFYEVLAKPKPIRGITGRTRRHFTKKRYETALKQSQQQISEQSWFGVQGTRTKVDADALRRAKVHEQAYRRLCAERLFEASVVLAFWGASTSETSLRNAVSTVLSSVSQEDRNEQIRVSYLRSKRAVEAIQHACLLKKARKSTDLSVQETSVYFQIPTTEFGLHQSSPAEFTTASTVRIDLHNQGAGPYFKPEHIALGHAYSNENIDQTQVKLLSLQDLKRHILIVGMTDMGKSNTKNRIVIDAWKNKVPSLLIEPVKSDARILMGAIPEMRTFTLGNETVTPYRDNPFWIEDGVPIHTHVNLLYSCFVAGWPLYGMLANHTRRIINQTYMNSGWDVLHNTRGKPITLDIFREEVERYCDNSVQYGDELSQDYRGALIARAEDLCDPTRAAIFNTIANLSTSELFSRPTIIELKHLGDEEFTAFTLSLLLVRIYEYFDSLGPTGDLRALLIIDEAHRVLEELPKTLDMSEGAMAKRKVVDQFVNLTAEARSYGLGVVILEQIPTRLARNALKNCHTTIVHKLKSEEDRNLIASEIGCTAEQREHMLFMGVGEAVVSDPSTVVPVKVKVFYDPQYYPEMKMNWTDEAIRERMQNFYRSHPDFAKTPEIPILPRKDSEEKPVYLAVKIRDVVLTSTFKELWHEARNRDQRDGKKMHIEELVAHYSVHMPHLQVNPMEIANQILEVAIESYGPLQRQPDRFAIRQYIQNLASQVQTKRRGQNVC